MDTRIVLISVDYNNARKVCELIQNQTYPTFSDLVTDLKEKLGNVDEVTVLSISDFMDGVNDQELDVLTDYFISYVKIDKKYFWK